MSPLRPELRWRDATRAGRPPTRLMRVIARGRRQRLCLHAILLGVAAGAITLNVNLPQAPSAAAGFVLPPSNLSGIAATSGPRGYFLQPGTSLLTADSIATAAPGSSIAPERLVRTLGGQSTNSFSSEVGGAIREGRPEAEALADVLDPTEPFVLYEMRDGDAASLLADRFGIQLRTLLENNPHLGDGQLVAAGEQVVVPLSDGIMYKVAQNDTLSSIVSQYANVTEAAVLDYRPNQITSDSDLTVGSYVLLPGATVKPPPPPSSVGPVEPGSPGGAPPAVPSGGRFALPLARWNAVTDRFGIPRGAGTYHTGIDLGLWGANGLPIVSACAGVVTRVEYLTYSYGYHVIVDCGDGWSTVYAHLSQIDATLGQVVTQGTRLGLSGSTGFSTGEHLHFEIRQGGVFMDPADFLPFS